VNFFCNGSYDLDQDRTINVDATCTIPSVAAPTGPFAFLDGVQIQSII